MKVRYFLASLLIIFLVLIFAKTSIKNSDVYITKGYSELHYYGELFVPIEEEFLPEGLEFDWYNGKWIDADVEGANWFLDKFILTDNVKSSEYDGEIFLYLESTIGGYYCLPAYKEKLMSAE